jgi:catechol 2,3-dioxygenase-like lactoylglutathione lyase family enzyme
MGKLRHIAMSVPDPWKTAEFYKFAFGMEVIGETDSSLAEGVFLSDGVINLALLHFKSDEAAEGTGRDHVGLHHFGVWVDDPEVVQRRVEEAGAEWLMGEPDVKGGSFTRSNFTIRTGSSSTFLITDGAARKRTRAPRGTKLVPRVASCRNLPSGVPPPRQKWRRASGNEGPCR